MKKIIIGIVLILLCAAMITYMIITISSNIPKVGLETGPGSIYQFQEPYPGAKLVLLFIMIAALLSFLIGIILISIGQGELR